MGHHDGRIGRRRAIGLGLAPLAGLLLIACGQPGPAGAALIARPGRDEWPAPFRQASPRVQAAYRFAVSPAGRETLRWMPCYCGCEADGHASNLDCYVDEVRPDGSVALDPMSFG
jgi:hypothetical protein